MQEFSLHFCTVTLRRNKLECLSQAIIYCLAYTPIKVGSYSIDKILYLDDDRQLKIDRLLISCLSALFWLICYVASHHLAVAPQSSVKDQFYSTLYYITLNPIWLAQRASKNLKIIAIDRVRSQNE